MSHTPQQLRSYRAKRCVSWQHSTAASTGGCTPANVFEGLHPGCSKPFEKGVQTFVLDRKTQRDTEVDIITPCVSVCARRERDVEELALREQPPGAIACVMTEKERNEQKVLHMLSGLFSVSSER